MDCSYRSPILHSSVGLNWFQFEIISIHDPSFTSPDIGTATKVLTANEHDGGDTGIGYGFIDGILYRSFCVAANSGCNGLCLLLFFALVDDDGGSGGLVEMA